MSLEVKLVQQQATVQSRLLRLENMFGLLVGQFRSWFKCNYPVPRYGKPKIGLKLRNKVDIKLRLLKDNVASSHIISLFFFWVLIFSLWVSAKRDVAPLGSGVGSSIFSLYIVRDISTGS